LFDKFHILFFLGHNKTTVVKPKECLMRQVVCAKHDINAPLYNGYKNVDDIDGDDLIFAIAKGISVAANNFNGCYTIDQAETLKDMVAYDTIEYFTGHIARNKFPNNMRPLIAIHNELPQKYDLYKKAIDNYLKTNRTKNYAKELQAQT